MKSLLSLMVSLVVGVSLSLIVIEEADAKRMGGGRSFGGKSTYSSPMNRSTPARQAAPSPAQQKNVQQRQAYSQRGGLMGMLGGLALGGLLGAMFFGGAFENINFMDILIFAGIAFLVYKLFAARRRRAAAQFAAPSGAVSTDGGFQQRPSTRRGMDTDLLFKRGSNDSASGAEHRVDSATRPAGFDESSFMSGAQYAYRQLQSSWDKGDLSDIRNLTTDAVYKELEGQIKERHGGNRTEILKLKTKLLDVKEEAGKYQASVLYDAQLREFDEQSGSKPSPQWVREVWHFVRPAQSDTPTWYLDGIQQLEK
jgi:predicted lipid-binding transport protein (Tim44 family)